MRTRGVLANLAILAVGLFAGCNTMIGNLGGYGRFRGHYLEPYGGVKLSLEAGTECWREATDSTHAERIGPFLAGTYVLGVDLPLCAVADTLTLPITIRAAQRGETINTPLIIDRPPTPAATADGLPARANTPPR